MGSGCHKSQVKQTGLFRAVGTPLHTNLVVRLIPITLRDASSGTMAGRPRPIQQSASAVGPTNKDSCLRDLRTRPGDLLLLSPPSKNQSCPRAGRVVMHINRCYVWNHRRRPRHHHDINYFPELLIF
jgi:hypothetical protein